MTPPEAMLRETLRPHVTRDALLSRTADETLDALVPALLPLVAQATAWQPIERDGLVCPRDRKLLFWIVPKTADETYTDTSGRPITADFEPYMLFDFYGRWGSLQKAVAWHEAPSPPQERAR